MPRATKKSLDLSTEDKIKHAALKLFTKKGYAATRTRDISEAAGINLALLNYYFRSKEKLFELLMAEILEQFFSGIGEIFNDEQTSLDEKISTFVARYTALLKAQPDLPTFIFHELRANPKKLASKVGFTKVFKSYFFKQLDMEMARRKVSKINPLHYVLNMLGMCVFPFIASPLLRQIAGIDAKTFDTLVDERAALVPRWMKIIMEGK